MSLLTEPGGMRRSSDGFCSRAILRDVSISDEYADRAWALVRDMCPEDADLIGRMLGIIEEAA